MEWFELLLLIVDFKWGGMGVFSYFPIFLFVDFDFFNILTILTISVISD